MPSDQLLARERMNITFQSLLWWQQAERKVRNDFAAYIWRPKEDRKSRKKNERKNNKEKKNNGQYRKITKKNKSKKTN